MGNKFCCIKQQHDRPLEDVAPKSGGSLRNRLFGKRRSSKVAATAESSAKERDATVDLTGDTVTDQHDDDFEVADFFTSNADDSVVLGADETVTKPGADDASKTCIKDKLEAEANNDYEVQSYDDKVDASVAIGGDETEVSGTKAGSSDVDDAANKETKNCITDKAEATIYKVPLNNIIKVDDSVAIGGDATEVGTKHGNSDVDDAAYKDTKNCIIDKAEAIIYKVPLNDTIKADESVAIGGDATEVGTKHGNSDVDDAAYKDTKNCIIDKAEVTIYKVPLSDTIKVDDSDETVGTKAGSSDVNGAAYKDTKSCIIDKTEATIYKVPNDNNKVDDSVAIGGDETEVGTKHESSDIDDAAYKDTKNCIKDKAEATIYKVPLNDTIKEDDLDETVETKAESSDVDDAACNETKSCIIDKAEATIYKVPNDNKKADDSVAVGGDETEVGTKHESSDIDDAAYKDTKNCIIDKAVGTIYKVPMNDINKTNSDGLTERPSTSFKPPPREQTLLTPPQGHSSKSKINSGRGGMKENDDFGRHSTSLKPPSEHTILRKELSFLPNLVGPGVDHLTEEPPPDRTSEQEKMRQTMLNLARALNLPASTVTRLMDATVRRTESLPAVRTRPPPSDTKEQPEADVAPTVCITAVSTPNLANIEIIEDTIEATAESSETSSSNHLPVLKKVSDFPVPPRKYVSPFKINTFKKPPKHMFAVPAVAKSEVKNKGDIKWTQVESNSPKAQMPWISRAPRFDVAFPPLGARLLKRMGSIECMQAKKVIPQTHSIEILKLEENRFPGLRVRALRRGQDKYSFNLPKVDTENEEDNQ